MVPTVLVISFGLLMCFDPFCARLVQWLDKTDSFIAIPHEQRLDWKLPPCLRVLRHVYRRGLDWFQQCQSFRLGYSSVLVHFVAYTHGWIKWTTLCKTAAWTRWIPSIHPCLRVLWHVYRRGLDWFQQHWSYIDCFPPPGVQQSTVKCA